MTIIDRYILMMYFRVLLLCFGCLAGLMVVVQLFTNLDDFIEYTKIQGSVTTAMLSHFGPYVLNLFERMSGLLCLLSGLFVIAWLYRTNELTAILAAGISKRRVVKPLLAATIGVITISTLFREGIVPVFQDQLDRRLQDLSGELSRPLKPAYDRDTGILIGGRGLLPAKNEIIEPSLRLPPVLARYGRQVSARLGRYLPKTIDRPAGYLLMGITAPQELTQVDDLKKDQTAVVLTPGKHPWLNADHLFVVSNVEFEMLRGGNSWKQYASTYEMITRLQKSGLQYSADVETRIHSRFIQPFLDFALVLLGLPIVLGRADRHLFWVAGASLLVVGGFMSVVMICQAIGASGFLMSPAMAAWLPMVIFFPWGWAAARSSMET